MGIDQLSSGALYNASNSGLGGAQNSGISAQNAAAWPQDSRLWSALIEKQLMDDFIKQCQEIKEKK